MNYGLPGPSGTGSIGGPVMPGYPSPVPQAQPQGQGIMSPLHAMMLLGGLGLASMMFGQGNPKTTKYQGDPNAGSLERAHWVPQGTGTPGTLGIDQLLPLLLQAFGGQNKEAGNAASGS